MDQLFAAGRLPDGNAILEDRGPLLSERNATEASVDAYAGALGLGVVSRAIAGPR